MSAPIKPKVWPDLILAPMDDELVVYNPHASELHRLNPQGSVTLQCFDGSGTMSEIAADIADAFGLPQEQVVRDVRRLYTQFRREGLIEGIGREDIAAKARRFAAQRRKRQAQAPPTDPGASETAQSDDTGPAVPPAPRDADPLVSAPVGVATEDDDDDDDDDDEPG